MFRAKLSSLFQNWMISGTILSISFGEQSKTCLSLHVRSQISCRWFDSGVKITFMFFDNSALSISCYSSDGSFERTTACTHDRPTLRQYRLNIFCRSWTPFLALRPGWLLFGRWSFSFGHSIFDIAGLYCDTWKYLSGLEMLRTLLPATKFCSHMEFFVYWTTLCIVASGGTFDRRRWTTWTVTKKIRPKAI